MTLVLLMWKWMGLFLRKNQFLRCLDWRSVTNWIKAHTLSLLLKLQNWSWFILWSVFLLRLLCISINSDRLHYFSVTIPRCYMDVYVNSFFPCMAKLWNSLPIECFPLTYDLSGFKSRINRSFNCRIFLNRFPVCSNLFMLLFLATPCLVVAVQPCMEWIVKAVSPKGCIMVDTVVKILKFEASRLKLAFLRAKWVKKSKRNIV